MSELADVAERLGALAQRDAPLGARTTYRVGGTAALLVEVAARAELEAVAAALDGTTIDVLVVGKGSNLLVADAGFDGLALSLGGEFAVVDDPVDVNGALRVRGGGAVALPVLARTLADRGFTGLEWAVGVPGTVGGAVRMNAGGHGSDTKGSLVSVEVFDLRAASWRTCAADDLDLAYRHSNLRAHDVVTSATFAVERGDRDEARATISSIVRWRREHQPGGSNAGSIFTNPPGDAAGRLVEASGLKGRRLGSAQVSEKHANFIQADADGSADDVAALIELVAETVREREGVTLETEVVKVGFAAP
jgi:UDP-N-acetylmuramate dehydrogenase